MARQKETCPAPDQLRCYFIAKKKAKPRQARPGSLCSGKVPSAGICCAASLWVPSVAAYRIALLHRGSLQKAKVQHRMEKPSWKNLELVVPLSKVVWSQQVLTTSSWFGSNE